MLLKKIVPWAKISVAQHPCNSDYVKIVGKNRAKEKSVLGHTMLLLIDISQRHSTFSFLLTSWDMYKHLDNCI